MSNERNAPTETYLFTYSKEKQYRTPPTKRMSALEAISNVPVGLHDGRISIILSQGVFHGIRRNKGITHGEKKVKKKKKGIRSKGKNV